MRKNKLPVKKYTVSLTKDEIMILIKATNWACEEYYKKVDPQTTIKVSDINIKLNRILGV